MALIGCPSKQKCPRPWRLAGVSLCLLLAAPLRAAGLPQPQPERFAQAVPPEPTASLPLVPSAAAESRGPVRKPPLGEDRPAVYLSAQTLQGQAGQKVVAEGGAELRTQQLSVKAQRLQLQPHTLEASGQVQARRGGDRFSGSAMWLNLDTDQGWIQDPVFFFGRTGAGGRASRVEFGGPQKLRAEGASYTSCPIDAGQTPAWQITADEVQLDFEANEGVAKGGVLRFFGVPLLPLPGVTFPATEERKSGWLAPQVVLYDSRNGSEVLVPYYWNMAPNRDMTFSPFLISRRGPGLNSEFRYLEPGFKGETRFNWLPHDSQLKRHRAALVFNHASTQDSDTVVDVALSRVSDDDYWKDFSGATGSITPRLLASDWGVARTWQGDASWKAYARVQKWQVLRDDDPVSAIEAPYERAPQFGLRGRGASGPVEWRLETEFNRFTSPWGSGQPEMPQGQRAHALMHLSAPLERAAWRLDPSLSFNAASYQMDDAMSAGPHAGQTRAARLVPTLSLDGQLFFEREAQWFSQDLLQTLEPRLQYTRTPWRDQTGLPNFDSAARDFNFESIYEPNAFTGVDRVSDSQQLTAGVVSRWLNAANGKEALRLGVVQRYRFQDQRLSPEGEAGNARFSDVLLLGGANIQEQWRLDSALQYNPDVQRVVRSTASARYSPRPFHNLSLTYNAIRGESEQWSGGWQWPLFGTDSSVWSALTRSAAGGGNCSGRLNTVGRVNFSQLERRVTGSLAGLEYESNCWTLRLAAERTSVSRSESAVRYMFQVELVGLSRFGANPFQVLKDNILGYRSSSGAAGPRATSSFYD
jgi:LPS-assembly protein